jgi:hypothetical protein
LKDEVKDLIHDFSIEQVDKELEWMFEKFEVRHKSSEEAIKAKIGASDGRKGGLPCKKDFSWLMIMQKYLRKENHSCELMLNNLP